MLTRSHMTHGSTRTRLVSALLIGVLLAACSSDTESRFTEIRTLQASGRLDQAIGALNELLAEDPDDPEANFMLAKALLQTTQPGLAIPALERASTDPRFARPAGLLLASTLFETGAFDQAIEASNRILARDPDNLTAMLIRGRARMRSHRLEDALDDANRILEFDPVHQNASLLKGAALLNLGRSDEAERFWIELQDRLQADGSTIDAARACGQLAHFYRTVNDIGAADRTYQRCLEQYPTQVYLQRWASDFYMMSNQFDRAIELHRKAIEAAPDDLRLRARLVNVLLLYREPAEAQKALEETVERFDSPEAWRLMADFHRRQGDRVAAREALEEAVRRTPEQMDEYLFPVADLLVEEGDIDRAREVGSQLRQPVFQHLLEGAIRLRLDEPAGALEELEASLAIWPQNPRARYLAGVAAEAAGDSARANTEYRRSIAFGGRDADVNLRVAKLERAAGRHDVALSFALRQISQQATVDPAAYRLAVLSAIELDDFDTAKRVVNALNAAQPETLDWLVESARIIRSQNGSEPAVEHVLSNLQDVSDPANERVLRGLIDDLNTLDRAAEGLGYVDAAIARDPDQASLHELRARTLLRLRRAEDAAVANALALQLDSNLATALELEAFLALERGDAKAALESLAAAAAAAPNRAQYSYAAASIARGLGDDELAMTRLEDALVREPGFASAANDLAWLLAEDRRDLDRALGLARLAADRQTSAESLDTLGWVRHQRGEYAQAVANFRSALALDPDRTPAKMRLGLSLAALGEISEARAVFERILEGPPSPEIDLAREELARLGDS